MTRSPARDADGWPDLESLSVKLLIAGRASCSYRGLPVTEHRLKCRSLANLDIERAVSQRETILSLLERTAFNRRRLDALAKCDETRCGDPDHCRDICPFGRERRKLTQGGSIARLLTNETELFEVRVSRASWSCGLNDLDPVTIGAVINLNRRALDKIHESVVAVGTIKVFASPASDEGALDLWRWEIHEVVSCSSRDLLDDAFSSGHLDPGLESTIRITEVRDLAKVIDKVLSHDLVEWKHPGSAADPRPMSKGWRRQYYRWALQLNINDLLIRYGCDRYFNRLNKPARPGPELKRPRPFPWQLARYQYGRHDYNCRCNVCINQKNRG